MCKDFLMYGFFVSFPSSNTQETDRGSIFCVFWNCPRGDGAAAGQQLLKAAVLRGGCVELWKS